MSDSLLCAGEEKADTCQVKTYYLLTQTVAGISLGHLK